LRQAPFSAYALHCLTPSQCRREIGHSDTPTGQV